MGEVSHVKTTLHFSSQNKTPAFLIIKSKSSTNVAANSKILNWASLLLQNQGKGSCTRGLPTAVPCMIPEPARGFIA